MVKKSIAAKMNISTITVNKILKKFRLFVKSGQINNLKIRTKAKQVIKDSQIEEIKIYRKDRQQTFKAKHDKACYLVFWFWSQTSF